MGPYHPIIVHFAVALLVVGVLLRVVSLLGRPAFVSPAAATLLILGTAAAALAVRSGDAAHGPVERIPGVRAAVVEHEEWGERTRNVFLGVAALEVLALALRRSRRLVLVHSAAAVVGLVGLWSLYETGEHGGRLVYSYAGGVGIRTGQPEDVARLLLTGLYHQAQQDRQAGKNDSAAALVQQAADRFPGDVEVQLLLAESILVDRGDPEGALAVLGRMTIPADSRPLRLRHANLRADALEAAGRPAEALAVLEPLADEFSTNARLQQRIEKLRAGARAPSAQD